MNRQQRRAAATRPAATAIEPLLREALAHQQAGLTADAEAAFRRFLADAPRHYEALNQFGILLQRAGRLAEALALFDRAIEADGGRHQALANRGIVLSALGRLADAKASFEQAIALADDFVEAHAGRGQVLMRLGRAAEALAAFDVAVALRPGFVEAWCDRGVALAALDRFEEADGSYDRALALRPDFAEVWTNRSAALASLYRHADSLEACNRALALRPTHVEALANRAAALTHLGRPAEALADTETALAIRPGYFEALVNRANALLQLGRAEAAVVDLDRALEQQPDDPGARFNRGQMLLLLGRYAEGWRDNESRWGLKRFGGVRRDFPQPLWRGEDLAGRVILLHGEQGLGDTIQFCRYAPLVAARGGVVIIEAPASLVPLLASLPGVAGTVAFGATLPPFDLHCPMMSLPLAFGTTPATIPAPPVYLYADPGRVEGWAPELQEGAAPRIGLVWSGNAALQVDPSRFMRLDDALPLLGPGRTFYALQKDVPVAEQALLAATPELHHLGARFGDWTDTAAVIAQLDLVITVDTSVAHLAAAMGKPTWLMLRAVADWRWGVGREESAWYPSARLFRQTAPGDWPGVVARVRGALAEFCRTWRPPAADAPAADLVRQGRAFMQARQLDAADAVLRRARDADPAQPDALFLGGVVAHSLGRVQEADDLFAAAIARNPANSKAHGNRGTTLRDLGRLDESLASFDRAIALWPRYADAWANRGLTLLDLGRAGEALASIDRALELQPAMAEAWANRAGPLAALGRFEEALADCDRALQLRPGDAGALSNRAVALRQLGRLEAALASIDALLAQHPNAMVARTNRAQICLELGRYREAWPDYEARWATLPPALRQRQFAQPLWQGEPLAGRTILLHAEQGFGDTIQFSRYASKVAERGGVVILEVQPSLLVLLSGLPGVARTIARGDEPPPFDLHCPLLSLPLAFGTTLATVPDARLHLPADPVRQARWASRLSGLPAPRVGLVWSGNLALNVDPMRSMRFATVRPLLQTGVAAVALQPDVAEADRAALAAATGLLDLGAELADWADTAAVIAQLDLVITIDTGVAHLAAALGKPTWVMLRHVPDWRWHAAGHDVSPWYPAARLFRQTAPGDWDGVVARVRAALLDFSAAWRAGDGGAVPPVVADPVGTSPAAWVATGLADLAAGRMDAAAASCRRALAADPGNAEALHLLGIVAYQTGRLAEANDLLAQALARAPDSPDMLNTSGLVLGDTGQAQAALDRFDRALALAPDFAEAHCNRGSMLRELGRTQEALASYDRALALRPDYVDALTNAGITLVDLGHPALALAKLDRALALDPNNAAAHNNRGCALQALRRLPEALASFARASELLPDHPEPWQRRAQVLADLGRWPDALASIDRAVALAPGDSAVLAARAALLARRERRR